MLPRYPLQYEYQQAATRGSNVKVTIQATSTDADVRDIRTARRLAEQLKGMLPGGLGYRVTVRRYGQVVARFGYDPIS